MAKKYKRREEKQKQRSSKPSALRLFARQMDQWPLLECIITEEWDQPGTLVQIAVVRKSPQTGQVAVAGYLVDLGCLGVKNALANIYPSEAVYQREYRDHLLRRQDFTTCDLNLAAKVIDTAVAYAASLGFKPHRDMRDADLIRGAAQPELCAEEVPVGDEDGKPFFIAGPYDNPTRIMRILDRSVGPGNYHFLMPIGDPFMDDEDEDEDDEM